MDRSFPPFVPSEGSPERSRRIEGLAPSNGVSTALDTNGGGRTVGTLGGIARHAYPKAPMETLDHVEVTVAGGIHGDFRGTIKPGSKGKRQVTLIERDDWTAAMAEVGHSIAWQERRSNLLVDGLDLPQVPGVRLRIGDDVLLLVTRETDPCERMEALAPGLKAALLTDWRGGVCTRVLAGGHIAIGDRIGIEEP